MEEQFHLDNDGQSVAQDDLNRFGKVAGLADDRVFAELFRMTPTPDGTTISKGVLPYAHKTSATTSFIAPNGASGSVLVHPFRALIGSRTVEGTEARDNWHDIRSALSVAAGSIVGATTVALAANASGNPRWDAIYATLSIDAATTPVTRKVKNPGTGAVTSPSVSVFYQTTLTVSSLAGTPAASPVWPSLSADSGSTFYVLLGYVRVPDGFAAGSTVLVTDIALTAPVICMSRSTGAVSVSTASCSNTELTTARQQAWGSSGTRPALYMPSTMVGGEQLIVFLDLTTGSETHVPGDVVDSRDWRGRIAKWSAVENSSNPVWNVLSGVSAVFPRSSDNTVGNPGPGGHDATTTRVQVGLGNSMRTSAATGAVPLLDQLGGGAAGCGVAMIQGINVEMGDTAFIQLYCRTSDGALCVNYANAPNRRALFWIDFSAVYDNYY